LIGDPYQAVKVVALVNYTDTNTLVLDVIIDNKAPNDNDTLGIANYDSFLYSVNILESSFEQQIGFISQLHAEVKLNDGIISYPTTWSSSDESIATIDQNGNIELLSVGSVLFKCEMQDNPLISDTVGVDVVLTPIPQNEIIITPLATTLLQNKEQIYDVYLYINGIQQSDVFVFSHSDVPSANYKFDVINGNSFKLTNIYLYPNNPLKISCTTGIENRDIYVNLKGLW
jgi:hypothetical protein